MMAFLTRQEVERTRKPFFTGHRWIGISDNRRRVLLSKNRCQKLGRPVQVNEQPAAYRYSVHGKGRQKYIPLFDRTHENIQFDQLYRKEIYPFQPTKRQTRVSLIDLAGIEKGLIIETFEKTIYRKSGLNVVDLSSNKILPLSRIYYQIRNVRDKNGMMIAKRKNVKQELVLIESH